MSAPKKPGKDLSALKARLAKKSAKSSAPSDVPAPGESTPEPAPEAEPAAAEPAAAPADVPAPGEVVQPAPAQDIPAPGQVSQPAPAPAAEPAQPAAPQGDGDPFGGGAAFDPEAGLIDDVGEVAPRKQTGLIVLAAVAALGIGIGAGWILHQGNDTRARVAAASKKADEMLAEVQKISETRKKISLQWEDFKKKATSKPEEAADMLTTMLSEDLKEFPSANALFGWQLASMDPAAIKRIFSLYEEANGLFIDLGYLANYVQNNAEALKEAGGPSQFAVAPAPNGAGMVMVELTKAICNIEEKTQCEKGKEAEAVGYAVREEIGGPEGIVSKEEAMPLLPAGKIFTYAFTETPGKNALITYSKLAAKVEQRLEKMSKLEKQALEALEAFGKDPDVDGSGGGAAAAE